MEPSTYGYWIEEDGTILTLLDDTHSEHLIAKLAPDHPPSADIPWTLAWDQGWIRIRCARGGRFSAGVMFDPRTSPRRALSALSRVLGEMGYEDIVFDLRSNPPRSKSFRSLREARAFINELKSSRRLDDSAESP